MKKNPSVKTSNKGFILAFGGLVVILLFGLAFIISSVSKAKEDVGPQTFPVKVEGESLPALQAGGGDTSVGMTAPKVTGVDFNGKTVSIGGATGKGQAIYMGAHWCSHCQATLPQLVDWVEDGETFKGVDVFVVSTLENKNQGNWPPSSWFKKAGWTGDLLVDDAKFTTYSAYGGAGTPHWVFIDSEGKVKLRAAGELNQATIKNSVDAIR